MHDVRAALPRAACRLAASVTSPAASSTPSGRRLPALLRPPHERPHLVPVRAQRVHDPRSDEARAAGDEDGHFEKFCQ